MFQCPWLTQPAAFSCCTAPLQKDQPKTTATPNNALSGLLLEPGQRTLSKTASLATIEADVFISLRISEYDRSCYLKKKKILIKDRVFRSLTKCIKYGTIQRCLAWQNIPFGSARGSPSALRCGSFKQQPREQIASRSHVTSISEFQNYQHHHLTSCFLECHSTLPPIGIICVFFLMSGSGLGILPGETACISLAALSLPIGPWFNATQ